MSRNRLHRPKRKPRTTHRTGRDRSISSSDGGLLAPTSKLADDGQGAPFNLLLRPAQDVNSRQQKPTRVAGWRKPVGSQPNLTSCRPRSGCNRTAREETIPQHRPSGDPYTGREPRLGRNLQREGSSASPLQAPDVGEQQLHEHEQAQTARGRCARNLVVAYFAAARPAKTLLARVSTQVELSGPSGTNIR